MPIGWFDRKKQESDEWSGFLEKGVIFEGTLESPGTLRIDCAFKGSIRTDESLILGENASIEGDVHANYVAISGRFDGTVVAKGKAEILTKAIVTGEIHTPCLSIEPGAIFDGQCHMLAVSPAQTAKPITIPIRSATAQAS
jgi:cytoskeletal protein CcmA (bactofilin family)